MKPGIKLAFIAAALVAAGTAYFLRSGGIEAPTGAAPEGASTGSTAPPGQSASEEVRGVATPKMSSTTPRTFTPDNRILEAPNVAQAIREARAAYGDSPLMANIERTAISACSADVDSKGTLLKGPPDKSRLWAAQALLERCKGWKDLPESSRRNTTPSPVDIARTNGKAAGLEEAMRVIRTSDIGSQLSDAGWLLLENGDPRIMQVPGVDPDLGFAERLPAWWKASTLWECEAQGGCGPQHVLTLAFCVNAGCREGVAYREALADATPAREMRATEAFLAWIRANRR